MSEQGAAVVPPEPLPLTDAPPDDTGVVIPVAPPLAPLFWTEPPAAGAGLGFAEPPAVLTAPPAMEDVEPVLAVLRAPPVVRAGLGVNDTGPRGSTFSELHERGARTPLARRSAINRFSIC